MLKKKKNIYKTNTNTMTVGTKSLLGVLSVGAFIIFVLGLTQLYHPNDSSIVLHAETLVDASSTPQAPIAPAVEKKPEPLPQVMQVTPFDGATDVILDIEDPITVKFDAPITNTFIDFQIEPNIEVVYENNPEKTEFRLLPKQSLALGVEYTLSINAKPTAYSQEITRKLATTRFTTIDHSLTAPQKEVYKKMLLAKNGTIAQVTEGRYIDVNLATQTMILFENGVALDAYLISSGKRGMDTPKGSYTIQNKAPRPWSKQYGLYMPNWMALTANGKYGIHELPEWPSGYKEGANHLGIPVSHGCVRLGVGPSKRVYDFAEVGTPVIVY
jgi:lipoprotein-anchoring transpeptidase ErfK/SrfK